MARRQINEMNRSILANRNAELLVLRGALALEHDDLRAGPAAARLGRLARTGGPLLHLTGGGRRAGLVLGSVGVVGLGETCPVVSGLTDTPKRQKRRNTGALLSPRARWA